MNESISVDIMSFVCLTNYKRLIKAFIEIRSDLTLVYRWLRKDGQKDISKSTYFTILIITLGAAHKLCHAKIRNFQNPPSFTVVSHEVITPPDLWHNKQSIEGHYMTSYKPLLKYVRVYLVEKGYFVPFLHNFYLTSASLRNSNIVQSK